MLVGRVKKKRFGILKIQNNKRRGKKMEKQGRKRGKEGKKEREKMKHLKCVLIS
jgi:hypothetical protein